MEKVVTIYGRLSHEHKKIKRTVCRQWTSYVFFYKSTSKIRKPPMQSTFCISYQHMAAPPPEAPVPLFYSWPATISHNVTTIKAAKIFQTPSGKYLSKGSPTCRYFHNEPNIAIRVIRAGGRRQIWCSDDMEAIRLFPWWLGNWKSSYPIIIVKRESSEQGQMSVQKITV